MVATATNPLLPIFRIYVSVPVYFVEVVFKCYSVINFCPLFPAYASSVTDFYALKAKAEQGDAKAQNNLGTMYEAGTGVQRDNDEAVKWYTKSAEQGNALAQSNLGAMYANGKGVPQDYKLAYKLAYGWFSLSAAQGNDIGTVYRDMIAKKLSPRELSEAQTLAAKMHQEIESRKE